MSDELPQGWTRVQAKDACVAVQSGSTPANGVFRYDGGIPFLKVYNIVGQKIDFQSKPQFIDEAIHRGPLKRAVVKPGDVLMNIVGPPLGKVAIVPENYPEWNINQAIVVFRPKPGLESGFLYLLLRSGLPYAEILQETRGSAGQSNISLSQCRDMELPIPPLGEQRRIVAKLETLLGKVDASQQRLAKIPVLLKRFRQSVLAAACSGRLTADWREDATPKDLIPPEPANPDEMSEVEETVEAPEMWRWLPLQVLCDPDRSICYGVIKLGVEVPDGIPCLRTSDVKPLLIDTTGVKRISTDISNEYERTLLRGGEVLVNVRGTLGGVAVVPNSLRGWNISREVAVIPVKGVVPQFIAFWIASLRCQNWLSGVAKGVAYTGINISDLKLLPVALPSLPEQQEIVRRVEGLFALADQLEERLAKARGQVDKLTPSLLARAFSGQLVPQDPTDEPAEKLLERIRDTQTNNA